MELVFFNKNLGCCIGIINSYFGVQEQEKSYVVNSLLYEIKVTTNFSLPYLIKMCDPVFMLIKHESDTFTVTMLPHCFLKVKFISIFSNIAKLCQT